jgi:hypothetical protein
MTSRSGLFHKVLHGLIPLLLVAGTALVAVTVRAAGLGDALIFHADFEDDSLTLGVVSDPAAFPAPAGAPVGDSIDLSGVEPGENQNWAAVIEETRGGNRALQIYMSEFGDSQGVPLYGYPNVRAIPDPAFGPYTSGVYEVNWRAAYTGNLASSDPHSCCVGIGAGVSADPLQREPFRLLFDAPPSTMSFMRGDGQGTGNGTLSDTGVTNDLDTWRTFTAVVDLDNYLVTLSIDGVPFTGGPQPIINPLSKAPFTFLYFIAGIGTYGQGESFIIDDISIYKLADTQTDTDDDNLADAYDACPATWEPSEWTDALSTTTRRRYATATRLLDGRIAVAGGTSGASYDSNVEIWSSDGWMLEDTLIGCLLFPRALHEATLLDDGRVLYTGGLGEDHRPTFPVIFDPENSSCTGTFTGAVRYQHTATKLGDGRVLITGGQSYTAVEASTEFFVPGSDTIPDAFTAGPPMNQARYAHTATLLPDGRVLVAGGYGSSGDTLESIEIYDPQSNSWTQVCSGPNDPYATCGGKLDLNDSRGGHTATLLDYGQVMIAGGAQGVSPQAIDTVEFFDIASESIDPSAQLTMNADRTWHTATELLNGDVLIAGGNEGNGDWTAATDFLFLSGLFNSGDHSYDLLDEDLNLVRSGADAVRLESGRVFLFGGLTGTGSEAGAEIYGPVQQDTDSDGVSDACDNCPDTGNPDQADSDGDGLGDACAGCVNDPDNDIDGDGVCGDVDNCPAIANADQADSDDDGLGDVCDSCANDPDNDDDSDGICGDVDNCPAVANADQADTEGDGEGDACDADDDNDGLSDTDEAAAGTAPLDPDTDDDGLNDGDEVAADTDPLDPDTDDDGMLDGSDTSPLIFNIGEIAKLLADDGAPGDYFGVSVTLSGNQTLVGAPYQDDQGTNSGGVYVFQRDPDTGDWSQVAKLAASDGAPGDGFGYDLDSAGDRALVGTYADPGGAAPGGVYVLERDPNTGSWSQAAKLTVDDAAAADNFGVTVALSGDRALVGAPGLDAGGAAGRAYLFERDASGTWSQIATLTADDDPAVPRYFGFRVALSGDRALIGASGDDDNGANSGSAYIFERDAISGEWTQTAKLTAGDGTPDDYFGWGLALSGSYALIGAYANDDKGEASGSAYLFEFDSSTGTWVEKTKLTASDGADGDLFGELVALSGTRALVTARNDDGSSQTSGSVYVFELDSGSGTWVETAKLTASDGAPYDIFGFQPALSGDSALIGAFGDDDGSGSAYLFSISGTDTDGDGTSDAGDNCPADPNPDQADTDGDSLGDVCDPLDSNESIDTDGDGVPDAIDAFPDDPWQSTDWDNDGLSYEAEMDAGSDPGNRDTDGDGIVDGSDNCPSTANPDQEDNEGDGTGDACDPNDDFDEHLDAVDLCPFDTNSANLDSDNDGVGDVCDNCPGASNPQQEDTDRDGIGDACEATASESVIYAEPGGGGGGGHGSNNQTTNDADGDEVADSDDNCPSIPNDGQENADEELGDPEGDACDSCTNEYPNDVDGDGYCAGAGYLPALGKIGENDNCPAVFNPSQDDFGGTDGVGDACDPDTDFDADGGISAAFLGDASHDPGDDCNDADPTVFFGAEDTPNGKDDDCDGIVDNPPYAVTFTYSSGTAGGDPDVGYSAWLPEDANGAQLEVHVTQGDGSPLPDGAVLSPISLLIDSSNHPGATTNDDSVDTTADFTVKKGATTLSSGDSINHGDILTIQSHDWGGSLLLQATAQVTLDGSTYDAAGQMRLPKDADADGIGDAFEAIDLDPAADIDTSLGNAIIGDGWTNFEEYRAVAGYEKASYVEVPPDSITETSTYLQDYFLPTGSYVTQRTDPTRKNFYVQYQGFGTSGYPFTLGRAFDNAGIDVFVWNQDSGAATPGTNHIDFALIALNPGNYGDGYNGHIHKNEEVPNDFLWSTMGSCGRRFATYVGYGDDCNVYQDSTEKYFSDRPYTEGTVDIPSGGVDLGVDGLDELDAAYREDVNDNAVDDKSSGKWESSGTKDQGILEGDLYVATFPGSQQTNTTYDVDNDGKVELPEVSGVQFFNSQPGYVYLYEYSKPHKVMSTITHELGHAAGAQHSAETACIMRGETAHWSNTHIFGSVAKSELIIWNR